MKYTTKYKLWIIAIIFIGCTESVPDKLTESEIYLKQVFYDPPEVLNYIVNQYERWKDIKVDLEPIPYQSGMNFYINKGANLTRLAFATYLNRPTDRLIEGLTDISDTLNHFLVDLDSNNSTQNGNRYENYIDFSMRLNGFYQINECLKFDYEKNLILEDHFASSLFGSWIEYLWITKGHLEHYELDTLDFFDSRLSLKSVKYHFEKYFNSELSEKFVNELDKIEKQFTKAIAYEYQNTDVMRDSIYKDHEMKFNSIEIKNTLKQIEELKARYLGY